jgi:hypothetical protein
MMLASAAMANAASIESRSLRVSIASETGQCEIVDRAAGVTWRTGAARGRFGEIAVMGNGKKAFHSLKACSVAATGDTLTARFAPLADRPGDVVTATLKLADNRLIVSYESNIALESIRLLEDALVVSGTGYALVPARLGLMIPADSGQTFSKQFDTSAYEGCHMNMVAAVGEGAAMLTWDDPYVIAEVRSDLAGGQKVATSLILRKSAKAFTLHLLGKSDVAGVAEAYREVAKQRGLVVTMAKKIAENAERAKLIGASNFKLWSMLTRKMNEESSKEQSVKVNWTFPQAGEVAEHLKNDLKMDKVLFTLGGWIARGYDNQHPDILPTAPELGGDEQFAAACKRIMAQGYMLSLHDNYQDIYRDSPSWDEKWIMRHADGSLAKGGTWAGGRAYLTCSPLAVELAKRPQNLAAVKKLSGANSYFIDTTYAAGLQECFSKDHPLTRGDDLRAKVAISDYARDVFGAFGSECGREWAIPHSDFFEGIAGVSGKHYHNNDVMAQTGAIAVPLFEMVYRDCMAMYGKYGYDQRAAAEYVLHHVSIGRPLHYHNVPAGLYWKNSSRTDSGDLKPAAMYTRADGGWGAELHPFDRFVKNTHEILSPVNEITSHARLTRFEFLTADRSIRRSVFGDGDVEVIANYGKEAYTHQSKSGGDVVLPPLGFVVESKQFLAFCATEYAGVKYDAPALFTIRALDGRAIAQSQRVRVFHGFGDPQLRVGGKNVSVEKEAVIRK